jgi:hypothetical protein
MRVRGGLVTLFNARSGSCAALALLALASGLDGCSGWLPPPSPSTTIASCFPGGSIVLENPLPGSTLQGVDLSSVRITIATAPALLSGGTTPNVGILLIDHAGNSTIPASPASLTGPVPAPATTISPSPFTTQQAPTFYASAPISLLGGHTYSVELASPNGCVPYPIEGAVFST